MNEIMRDEILDQPDAVAHCLPLLRAQAGAIAARAGAGFRRLILAGSGDSYFAALALQAALRTRIRVEVQVATALEAARYWAYQPGDALVAISISGESARVLEAARAATEAEAQVLALTAHGESSLAGMSHAPLVIPFRSRSRVTPHTTDYMTTLLALAVMAEALAGREEPVLGRLAGQVRAAVESLEAPCRVLGERLADAESFYFLGAGPNLATGWYAAAKFWEAGGLRASACDIEEFGHGPHLAVDAGDAVFVLAPSGRIADRAGAIASGIRQVRATSVVISDTRATATPELAVPWLEELWSPLLMCIPLQWITWAVATAKGCDVMTKDYRHANAKDYETLHWQLVRG